MNINELEQEIIDYQKIVPPSVSETVKLTLPLHTMYNEMRNGVTKIQDIGYGLGNSEIDVLITTYALGDKNLRITPKKLTEKLIFSSGGITKVLKKLKERKLILRIDCTHDKRSTLVQITKEGEEICKKVFKEMLAYEAIYFSPLSDEEKETFYKLLIKMIKNF